MLENILNATSVAIVGASKSETKRGFQAIRTLLNEKFEGRIYPVNPKEKNILGFKCYPTVSDILDPVDIALITTPAKTIPSVLRDCGKKGVHGAVIIAGGFGETGAEGKALEAEMVAVAREQKIRLIGPNTSGMISLKQNLNLVGLRDVPKGDIALLTQSGKKYIQHACGHVRDLVLRMKQHGAHGIESISPPPTGNISIKAARAQVGDDFCIIGGIEPTMFLNLSLEELGPYVEQVIDEGLGGPFILANSDSCPPGVTPAKYALVAEIARGWRL